MPLLFWMFLTASEVSYSAFFQDNQCFPFRKLCFHLLLYCRLKDGALVGYQLINKLQSCHSVTKVSIDQSANLGPGLLNGNLRRLRENACGTYRPIPVFVRRSWAEFMDVYNIYKPVYKCLYLHAT